MPPERSSAGLPLVDGARDVAQHHHRLVRARRDGLNGARVGLVAVVLLDEVESRGHHSDAGILVQRGHRRGEQCLRVRAAPPDVQRVRRDEAGVEQLGQHLPRLVSEHAERDTERIGAVSDQGTLAAGVVDRGDAELLAAPCPAGPADRSRTARACR